MFAKMVMCTFKARIEEKHIKKLKYSKVSMINIALYPWQPSENSQNSRLISRQ